VDLGRSDVALWVDERAPVILDVTLSGDIDDTDFDHTVAAVRD